jgi:hypothetical protein
VLQGFVQGTGTAEHHDEVLIFEAWPADLFPFDQVHGKFNVERRLDGAAQHFAIALPRMAVAQKEQRAGLDTGSITVAPAPIPL